MSNWPISSLKGKLFIKHGFPFKSEFFTNEVTDYIVLTPGNFYEEGGFKSQVGKEKYYTGDVPQGYLHKAGDLIVAMTEQAAGLLGSCARVPKSDHYLHNQRLGLITTDPEKLLVEYVYHLFKTKSVREQIRLTSSGSKVKHTSPERIYDVKVPLPDVIEQKKILKVLDDLESKINLNRRISSELEQIAKTIYDYWFIQFDFPDLRNRPYKKSGGKMIYNKTLRHEIPEGWEVKKLGKVVKTSLGGTPSTKNAEYWDNADIPWLNSGEVANFPIIGSEENVTLSGLGNSAAELMPKGSVVLSIVRHLRVSILAIDAAFNQSVVGLRETETLKNGFLYPYLSRELPRLMSLRTGAQQPHINKGIVDDSNIIIPKEDVLKEYYKIIEPIFEKINVVSLESKKLEELRDWLLPMLMNGQVTVK
ncbi:restriction endonuclease subunit S [Vibrio sp. 1S139]|uniref:restriction endonuclease subunit S n=1 Tax=Vibrio sp. 1S139 TaxID=3230006 RepID=UPI00352D8926